MSLRHSERKPPISYQVTLRSHVERNVFQTGAIHEDERADDGRTNCIFLGLYLKSLFAVLLDESIAERGIAPGTFQAHDRCIQFVIVDGFADHARHQRLNLLRQLRIHALDRYKRRNGRRGDAAGVAFGNVLVPSRIVHG